MKFFRTMLLALLAFVSIGASAAPAQREYKVVYHITDSSRASTLLVNIRNHLKARPATKIVVVANGDGVDFLLEGAKNKNGNPYDASVEEFSMHDNVEFKVCNNTLLARHIDKSRVLPEASFVEAGIDEVTRLQIEEGYAYVKP
jgi:intracellular sulfur oxidation DsrE/DsrF family protein